MNSIFKYLLTAFLGLGICGGVSVEFANGANQGQQQQVQVDCTKVIRDYIDVIRGKVGYGNVLAFKCNVRLNGVNQNDVIIILKNGDLAPPQQKYVQFEQHFSIKSIPNVYYIPFRYILNSVGINKYAGIAANAKDQDWRNAANTFSDDVSYYMSMLQYEEHLEARGNNWYSCQIDVLYNMLGGSEIQNDYNGINLRWWNKAKHTEVQFYVLKHLGAHEEIMIENDRITLTGIDNVTELYSMFEPCTSCRELTLLTMPTIRKFEYFAFDKDMPNTNDESFTVKHDIGYGLWFEEKFKTNNGKQSEKVEIDPPCDWLKNAMDISSWKNTQCASKRYRKVSKMYDSYLVKKNGDKHTCNLAGKNIKEDTRWINFDTKEFEQ